MNQSGARQIYRHEPGPPKAAALVGGAALAALVLLGVVLLDLGHHPFADLVQPGQAGPAAPLVTRDFPHLHLPPGRGNDGQAFYAIARDPLHPTATAVLLDRARYRLQRPGYPVLAWVIHPTGGGNGLVGALLAVNVAAGALAAAALGWWAARRGRSPWWGLAALLLPGAFMATRISCADLLAGGLSLLAAALFLEDRPAAGAATAVAAALTKETALLAILAIAVVEWRRRPRAAVRFALPASAVVGTLWLALLATFPHVSRQYGELGFPLRGLADSARYWRATHDWKPAATVLASVGLGFAALGRRVRSPFAAVTAVYLALALFQAMATLAYWTSAPRTLYPLGLFAVAALVDRSPAGALTLSAPRPAPV